MYISADMLKILTPRDELSGLFWEIKNPLGNPADFPGERKGGKMHLLPFAKYIIGKQGVKLKWKIHLKIHFRIA
jgi:hypothetical protein